jgi:type I restriction enzyme M protein
MIAYLKEDGRAGIVLPDGSLTGDGVKQRIREKLLTDCNLHTIVRLPNSVFQPYASVATNLLFFTKGTPTKEIWYYEHKLPDGQKAYSKTKLIKIEEFESLKIWWNERVENEQAWKVDIDTIKNNGFNLDIKNPHKQEDAHTYTSRELLDMLSNSFAKSSMLLEKLKSELAHG